MSKIKVENIKKVFNPHSRNRNQVLNDVSFELPDKGLVAIYGKSGSGKTTLLNIIGGLERQDGGKIYIDGECASGKADRIRNEKIGFIFQNYYLENGYTIAEIMRNAMLIAGFQDEKAIARRSQEVLTLVDMERFKNKQGDALSGGQKQRVAIARALIKGADIILADEPTGNLDAENTMKVMEILKEVSKTKLVVVVTHEITLIKKYADSYIKLVDGQLVENAEIDDSELVEALYGAEDARSNSAEQVLNNIQKSGSRRNGRLFGAKSVFKQLKREGADALYSTANLFKQIFILLMAVLFCFFAFFANNALTAGASSKATSPNSLFVSMDVYTDLRSLNEEYYTNIGFFETDLREGSFLYSDMAALSDITASYTPAPIESGDEFENLYGKMPESGEVLISRALAETLKTKFRLKELQSDRAVFLIYFEGEYRISGIVPDNEPVVYLNKADYVNFLDVYDYISFTDNGPNGGLFFSQEYQSSSYSAEICLQEEGMNLSETEVRIEISRNSLYKMTDDVTYADTAVQSANRYLSSSGATATTIQITDSKLFVQRIGITRDLTNADVRIYVNENTLANIFVYLKPNLDLLQSTSGGAYFEVETAGGEQLSTLKNYLQRDRGIAIINIASLYDAANAEARAEASGILTMFYVAAVLVFAIYFFMAKSASVKNSKEYGVYRAIGVNRSNLLFKETFTTAVTDIASYLVFFVIAVVLVAIWFAIENVSIGLFIGLVAAIFAATSLIMLGISLMPYLFVLTKSTAQILAQYDI